LSQSPKLISGNADGQQSGNEENYDKGVRKLFEEKFPPRCFGGRSKDISSKFVSIADDLSVGESFEIFQVAHTIAVL
jgi:hypothetical protein